MISESRVDDDKEHHIRLERRGRRGILKVDNEVEQSGLSSSGILAMLNADGNIFRGVEVYMMSIGDNGTGHYYDVVFQ
ncbi:hypothetical protein OSTOST_05164 [Ostertagia ostertagi]